MKKKPRKFQVKETFQDPYVAKTWRQGEDVSEKELAQSGWKPSDIDRAVGNLLVPYLWPLEVKKEDGGLAAGEVTNGKSNG